MQTLVSIGPSTHKLLLISKTVFAYSPLDTKLLSREKTLSKRKA